MNSKEGNAPMGERWRWAIIPLSADIQRAIASLNQTGLKLLMVLDEREALVGTVSDGDIRRGLLRGLGLSSPVAEVLHSDALVVPPAMALDVVMQVMIANGIEQIPIVDDKRRVVGLHLWNEVMTKPARSNLMVIMAGGLGTRLRPLTETCPKPLLSVSGKPMLEHIIERATSEGFTHFKITIHYLGHMIEEHFGDGSRWGVKIDYIKETSPLGTAGALSLIVEPPSEPFVVTNGDVLTDIRYGELLDFHRQHKAAATMAVRPFEWQHPFGVVSTSGIEISGFEEKPVFKSHVNAGIYVLSPETLEFLENNEPCDMPKFFEELRARGRQTIVYPMHEPWLDVGRHDDLMRANQEKN